MPDDGKPDRKTPSAPTREDRLAEALKSNLRRRKAQARARRDTEKPCRDAAAAPPADGD